MQSNFKAIGKKVVGVLVDNYGVKKLASGLYINDADGTAEAIRPRWFKITHIGPEQSSVVVNDYVLVSHGRWSRGFNLDKSSDVKYYHIDEDEILLVSDTLPKDI